MASKGIIKIAHNNQHLYSLSTFQKALPEFFDCPSKPFGIIDKAFHAALVEGNSDQKYWKGFRQEFTAKELSLAPRELSRLKFALSHKGQDLSKYVKLGRAELHSLLDKKCQDFLPHMNAIELLSAMFGFSRVTNEKIYSTAFQQLLKELDGEKDLDVLALAPYITAHTAIHTRYLDPHRQKEVTYNRNLQILTHLQPRFIEHIKEFTDDQLATICAGIANSNIPMLQRMELEELMDAIEEDMLHRRAKRMSAENLVDVVKAFTNINLGSDQLFDAIKENIAGKISSLSVDSCVDLGYSWSHRDKLSDSILQPINAKLKQDLSPMRYDFTNRLAMYLYLTACQDKDLLSSYVKYVEAHTPIPINKYWRVRWLKLYLEAKFPNLITEEFHNKVEKESYLYRAARLSNNAPEYNSNYFERFSDVFVRQLGFDTVERYPYKNIWTIDYGFMPQKVGVYVALPDFHLVGKVAYDSRIVKEPALKYRASNFFRMRSELMKYQGWKIVEFNYYDIMENVSSVSERNSILLAALKKHNIEPVPRVASEKPEGVATKASA